MRHQQAIARAFLAGDQQALDPPEALTGEILTSWLPPKLAKQSSKL